MTIRQNTQRWAWTVFVGVLPLQTAWLLRESFFGGAKWQYGTVAVYAFQVAAVIWLATIVCSQIGIRRLFRFRSWRDARMRVLSNSGIFFGVGFLAWCALSCAWSSDPLLSCSYAVSLALGGAVVWGVRARRPDTHLAARVFVAVVAMQALLGIGQFVTQSAPGFSVLGMAPHDAYEAGTSVLKTDAGRWLRAYGGFSHPNVLGAVLAAGTVLTLGALIFSRRAYERIGYGAVLGILLLGLLVTFSRVAWLGALLGAGVFWARSAVRKKAKRVGRVALLASASVALFAGVLSGVLSARFDERVMAREGSVTDRVAFAKTAMAVWEKHPFVGTGAGTETLVAMQNAYPDGMKNISVWEFQPAHVVFLLVLAETGIVGCLLFAGAILAAARVASRAIVGSDDERALFACALLALVPSAFLDHWLWTSSFGILLAAWLLGCMLREHTARTCQKKKNCGMVKG